MKSRPVFSVCLLILFTSCSLMAQERLAIPRFVSLKMGEVNLRTGPGGRYPIKYVYKKKHYPMEIVDEHELWRQVREIDGTVGWVHRRMLTGVRYALLKKDTDVFKKPDVSSKIRAIASKDVLGKIEECPKKSEFCKLDFELGEKHLKGWVKRDVLYGIYPNEEIK